MIYLYLKKIKNLPSADLPKNLEEHVNEYKKEELHKVSGYSYYLLSEILKKMGHHPECIRFTFLGKPYMDGIHFSISHSKTWIVVAVSDDNVGVDVEEMIPDARLHLSDKILSEDEKKEFQNTEDKSLYLTEKWTLMEAMGKWDGAGIKEELFKKKKEGRSFKLERAVVSVYPSSEVKLSILGDGDFGKSE